MPEENKPVRKSDLIADSIWESVIWPEIRKMILDGVNKALSMLLHEPIRDRRDRGDGRAPYRSYYDNDNRSSSSKDGGRSRSIDCFDDILFPDRGRAERVLADLEELCYYDKKVSVGKFIDVARQRKATIEKNVDPPYWDYGWTSMEGVEVVHAGNDWYYIDLPPAKFLGERR